jgi:peptidoglycan/LPS O-acetylase OafA/YrhL
MRNRKEFWALDWVRFVLAFYLVIYHTWHEYPAFKADSSAYSFFGLGNMATSIFFVLSGFLLTHVYASDTQNIDINKKAFWISRFSTLYPLHIFGLVLCLPTVFIIILRQGGIEVALDPTGTNTRILGINEAILGLVSQLTLTHAWNPFYLLFDIPSWSLSALFFFYLLFPYLVPKLVKLSSPLAGLLVLGVLFTLPGAVAQFYNFTGLVADGVLHHNPIVRLPLFLSGIVLYAIYQRGDSGLKSPQKTATRNLVFLAVIGLTILIAAHFYEPGKENVFPLIRNGLYFPSALAVVWLAVGTDIEISSFHRQWSARLGKASLSIFMLHLPLFSFLMKAEKFARALLFSNYGLDDFSSLISHARGLTPLSELYIVHLVVIVWLCTVFQKRVVTPLQVALKKKLMGGASRETPPYLPDPIDTETLGVGIKL